jgi:mono/diheme cytochrome c family protein
MWHVVNYLRTLSKKDGAASASDAPGNPVAVSPESVALGKQLYVRFCVVCHGANGKGDTEMREFLPTHPSDLTDAEWKYGARDGDIFLVIKDGTEYDMEAFADRLTDERIWHVVNYLRSFGPKSE